MNSNLPFTSTDNPNQNSDQQPFIGGTNNSTINDFPDSEQINTQIPLQNSQPPQPNLFSNFNSIQDQPILVNNQQIPNQPLQPPEPIQSYTNLQPQVQPQQQVIPPNYQHHMKLIHHKILLQIIKIIFLHPII